MCGRIPCFIPFVLLKQILTFEVESSLSNRSSWGLKRTALVCSQTVSELFRLGVRFWGLGLYRSLLWETVIPGEWRGNIEWDGLSLRRNVPWILFERFRAERSRVRAERGVLSHRMEVGRASVSESQDWSRGRVNWSSREEYRVKQRKLRIVWQTSPGSREKEDKAITVIDWAVCSQS